MTNSEIAEIFENLYNILSIDEKTKQVNGWYIQLLYIFKNSTIIENMSKTTDYSHPPEKPHCGNTQGVEISDINALSSVNLNALSSNKQVINNKSDLNKNNKNIFKRYSELLKQNNIIYKPLPKEYIAFSQGRKNYDFTDDEICAFMEKWFSRDDCAWSGYKLSCFWGDIGKLQIDKQVKQYKTSAERKTDMQARILQNAEERDNARNDERKRIDQSNTGLI